MLINHGQNNHLFTLFKQQCLSSWNGFKRSEFRFDKLSSISTKKQKKTTKTTKKRDKIFSRGENYPARSLLYSFRLSLVLILQTQFKKKTPKPSQAHSERKKKPQKIRKLTKKSQIAKMANELGSVSGWMYVCMPPWYERIDSDLRKKNDFEREKKMPKGWSTRVVGLIEWISLEVGASWVMSMWNFDS